MEDIQVAVIGEKNDINTVLNALKYPQIIAKVYYYGNDLINFSTNDFLNKWNIFIIAIKNADIALRMCNLIKKYRIDDVVILDYYRIRNAITPLQKVDLIMNNPQIDSYDGLIFGISHGEVGIISNRLDGFYANLCVSSQDIFYNAKTLEYCISNYYNKIKNINTVIIDMFDYSYFNYDVSLSSDFFNYLNFGGFNKNKHNFDENKFFQNDSYDQLVSCAKMMRVYGLETEILSIWKCLFKDDVYQLYDNLILEKYSICERIDVVSDEAIEDFAIGRFTKTKFDKTINENISCIDYMLEKLNEINKNIRIFFVLIPRNSEVWNKEERMVQKWKKIFYSILDDLYIKYNFEVLDYSRDKIAFDRAYYYDAAHFNFIGAMKYTDKLKNDIKKLNNN